MNIKNLTLSSCLLSIAATPIVFAGNNGVSGNGCAIAHQGQTITVNTTLNGQEVVDQTHGIVEAGTKISRFMSFTYNLHDVADVNCASGLIDFGIANIVNKHDGPIRLNNIFYQDLHSKQDLTNGATVKFQQQTGVVEITLNLEYEVIQPTKLVEAFSYSNSFDLVLKVGNDTPPSACASSSNTSSAAC